MNRPRIIGSSAFCTLLVFVGTSAACARPVSGDHVGKVSIPKIHLNIEYVEGTSNDAAVPGVLPVHYRSTNLPGEGQAIMISAHHFTHDSEASPGVGGPFLYLDHLMPGDSVYLSRYKKFGGGKFRYVVASNRTVDCGHTSVGFYYCPAALRLMKNYQQTKVWLVTCIGDGYARRIVTAYLATEKDL